MCQVSPNMDKGLMVFPTLEMKKDLQSADFNRGDILVFSFWIIYGCRAVKEATVKPFSFCYKNILLPQLNPGMIFCQTQEQVLIHEEGYIISFKDSSVFCIEFFMLKESRSKHL